MKKLLALLLCVVLTLGITACGGGKESAEENIVLKIAAQGAPESHEIEVLNNFEKIVEEKSNNSIDVQVFPSGQLGTLPDMIEGVSLGTVDMCFVGLSNLQSLCPSFAAYDMWLYDNAEDVVKVYNSEVGEKLNQELIDTANVRLLSYSNCQSGRMYLWSNEPLTTMDAYEGLVLRVPDNKSISTALGAIGTTSAVGFGDMYTAAQTGLIDVGSADISTMINSGYDDVFKYCNEVTPNYMPLALTISESVFGQMSENQKKIVEEAATEACQVWDDKQDELEAESMELLQNSKAEYVEMEPKELEKMNKLIRDAIEKYLSETIDPKLVSDIRSIVEQS